MIRFRSHDHEPPHIHVLRRGEWEIRVDIRETTADRLSWSLKWPPHFSGPPANLKSELAYQVSHHRTALLQEWDQKVCLD